LLHEVLYASLKQRRRRGARFQRKEAMPAAGEVEQYTGNPFWGSKNEEEGHKGDIGVGGEEELTGASCSDRPGRGVWWRPAGRNRGGTEAERGVYGLRGGEVWRDRAHGRRVVLLEEGRRVGGLGEEMERSSECREATGMGMESDLSRP
jgi:hypothetical protein